MLIKLLIKNSLRHKLRTMLTIVGIAIAVIAFGLLRTVVTAWYAGIEASAANRLIVRQSVSFIFTLPYAYREQIARVPGVETVSFFNWFGGVYIDKNQFFARMACDPNTLLDVYPEFITDKTDFENFKKERNSCIVGSKLAEQYNLKIGDVMNMDGDIYPGQWQFTVRAIYKPRDKTVDATQMFFHWAYLDERMKQDSPGRDGQIGWYVVKIKDPGQSAAVSEYIDGLFKNSRAETKTETEKAFQQGFIAASSAFISAMNGMSFVIIGIIMLVLGNTMIMSARERTREYAVLRTLGFSNPFIMVFISGESIFISLLGGALGLLLMIPFVNGFESAMPKGWFPIFNVANSTIVLSMVCTFLIGVLASLFPIQRALKTKIVDGLRYIG